MDSTTLFESKSKCRICLEKGEVPIFGNKETVHPDISTDVEIFGNIQIQIDDNFPKHLCRVCQQMLQVAVLFRKIAQKSDKFLKYTKYRHLSIESEKSFSKKICSNKDNFTSTDITTESTDNEDYNSAEKDMDMQSETKSLQFEIETMLDQKLINNSVDDDEELVLIIVSDTQKCNICNKELGLCKENKHHCDSNPEGNDSNSNILKNHPVKEELKMKCPICNNMYRKCYYNFHLATHNRELRKYICEKCGKTFIQPTALKIHSLTHSDELPLKCHFCPYRGRHLGLLKVHLRTHTGEYPYKCSLCSSCFITKSNLNMHLKRHTGPIHFECQICNKGFYSKLDLDRHHKVNHLDIKDHVCNICGKAFGYKANLLGHQMKVHNREKLIEAGQGRIPMYKQLEINNGE